MSFDSCKIRAIREWRSRGLVINLMLPAVRIRLPFSPLNPELKVNRLAGLKNQPDLLLYLPLSAIITLSYGISGQL